MPTKLILIRGLPGSGKSTWARQLLADGVVQAHFEIDMHFVGADGVYRFEPHRYSEAEQWCREETVAALETGQSVVVSNTFCHPKEIKAYEEIAERFGAQIEILEAKGEWQNLHGVSNVDMASLRNRWR